MGDPSTVEGSPIHIIYQGQYFADSFRAAAVIFEPLHLAQRLSAFTAWKRGGAPAPTTADKASGHRPDGTVFEDYVSLGLRHFHLDLVGTEPLLAYQVQGNELTLIALTSHREMFGGNERRWLRRYRQSFGTGKRRLAP